MLFQNKFRKESARLKEWDYSNPWWYYITICTKNHSHFFGEISNGQMNLNKLGLIAKKYWEEIPKHYQNVEIDYYVVMPNYIHGIIIINPAVETRHASSLPINIRKYHLRKILYLQSFALINQQ